MLVACLRPKYLANPFAHASGNKPVLTLSLQGKPLTNKLTQIMLPSSIVTAPAFAPPAQSGHC